MAGIILERSGSVLFSALAFVVSYIPGIGGALLLGPLADRLPRRELLIACDLLRAAVVGVLWAAAVIEAPLWSLMVLLLATELVSAPFDAAKMALLPDVLPDPRDYHAGAGACRVLYQLSQVVGLTGAGIVIYGASGELALLLDAVTYLVSAAFLVAGLRRRPAALSDGGGKRGALLRDVAVAVRALREDRVRRVFVLLGWSAGGVVIAPEGVALAYAVDNGDARLGGALIAALPAGAALGAFVLARYEPAVAVRAIRPLLLAGCLPLLLTGLDLGVYPTMALWFFAGACQAFLLPIMVVVNLLTLPERRGAVNGLAAAGFNAAVAGSFVLAGWAADAIGPARAVAVAGALGLVVLALAHLSWPRVGLAQALAATAPRNA